MWLRLHADPLVQACRRVLASAASTPVPPPVVSSVKCGACGSDLIDHDFVVERAYADGEFAGLTLARFRGFAPRESVLSRLSLQLPDESSWFKPRCQRRSRVFLRRRRWRVTEVLCSSGTVLCCTRNF